MSTRIALGMVLFATATASAADWPQWRGPDRSNVSTETGLLKEWPKDGPPLAWKADGLGDGVVPVSVAGGRVFTTGNVGADVICTARSESDGKPLWSAKLGPAAKEMAVMRWLSQTAPTVDGDRLYAVSANGDYVCLAADTGKELWRKHFQKDFDGKKSNWGYCDYPLVDGDRVILTPGGEKAAVVALDRKSGEIVWKCAFPGGDVAAHSVLVVAEIGGVRQYVNHLGKTMVGVAAADGKLLWTYTGLGPRVATTHAPVVFKDTIFYASGYGVGHVLLKITNKDGTFAVEPVYKGRGDYVPWLGSPTQMGDHLILNTSRGLDCLSRKDGAVVWKEDLGRCTYTVADGRLYVRSQKGPVLLADAGPAGFHKRSEFILPATQSTNPAWTFPVVANGRLYLRDFDTLFCYDVRDLDVRKRKAPDAVFVPTPPDVVTHMLDLAGLKKGDLVYDLGSGDGRILIAAAKAHGCKAVGVEIDRELVKQSREAVKEAGVEKLVTIEHGDLFEADFAKADVVAVYILPTMLAKLVPKFNKLKPGSRIVAHAFAIPGVKPAKVTEVTSEEDGVKRKVYLYTVPLSADK
jgi:outer membrane protein assembly factor BamB/protein-L-isoaspartate O-methyltransferase